MIRKIRKLHWALRLVVWVMASSLSILALGYIFSVGTTSLNGIQRLQFTMIIGVGLLGTYAFLLFGGKQDQK